MAEHKVSYTGSKRLGYSWECSCGERSQEVFTSTEVRREDAARHLRREEPEAPIEEFVIPGEDEEMDHRVAYPTQEKRSWGTPPDGPSPWSQQ